MNVVDVFVKSYEFNRGRTLGLLEKIEQQSDPQDVLAWRPGDGRAHIGWQLMHIGVTEELFATDRLAPDKPPLFVELRPRFRGGSTPDAQVPTTAEIRQVLGESRRRLVDTLSRFGDDRLDERPTTLPPAMIERKFTVRDVLALIAWHEAHHHGQAHITLNLCLAQRA